MGKVIMFKKAVMVKRTETLPNRIREWRLLRNVSMQQLADQLGVSMAQVQRMETGVRRVSFEHAERIARALDVTVGDLLDRKANPFHPTEREQRLLELLRQGGEPVMKAAETIVTMQLELVAQRSEEDAPSLDEEVAAKRA